MIDPLAKRDCRWLFDAAVDAMLIVDHEGRIAALNPAAARLLGYNGAEAHSLTLNDLIPEMHRKVHRTNVASFLDAPSKRTKDRELAMAARHRDGSKIPVEISLSPLEGGMVLATLLAVPQSRTLELALQENEQRLRTLIDASPDFIYFKDGCGRWMVANPAALKLFELDGIDYQGKSDRELAELILPCYREALEFCAQSDEQAWRSTTPTRSVECVVTANGKICYADVIKQPLYEPDGRRKGLVILGRDITELKRAEEALRRSEEQLALAVKGANLGLWNLDLTTGRVERDDTGALMLGLSLDAIPPTLEGCIEMVHPADQPALRQTIADHIEGRTTECRSEHRVRTHQGTWHWVLYVGQTVARDISGNPLRMAGIYMDIHNRKLAEEELRESEARMSLAMRSGDLGLWDWDLVTGEIECSEDWLKSLGYEPGEIEPNLDGCRRLVHPEDFARTAACWDDYITGRTDSFRNELRIKNKSGVWKWYLDNGKVSQRCNDGTPLRATGIFFDIDARKRSEHALREQRAEMERLMHQRVASLTAAAIAHELNQPLNAISAYSEAALRLLESGNPKPETLERALRQAVQQTQRAGQVMRDLLALLHRGETHTDSLCLNSLLRSALEHLHKDELLAGINTITLLETNLALVRANRLHVDKVLHNLILNAVEAMGGNDADQRTLRVTTGLRDGMALISVRDAGPGIPAEDLAHVFEPFFTTKPNGSGMGLAISYALISSLGGDMWAESSPNEGATFYFTLPLAT